MRTEAQKEADARYWEKRKGKVCNFVIRLSIEEAAIIDSKIKKLGMKKAEFIRYAVSELIDKNNNMKGE